MLYRLLLSIMGVMMAGVSSANTVWWRTNGATVMQETNVCSLYLYDDKHAVIFTWNKTGTESVAFDEVSMNVEGRITMNVQIGDTWLHDTVGLGETTMVIVLTEQPIIEALRQADHITIIVPPTHQFVINVSPAKMTALLTAVGKCQAKLLK